MKQKNIIKTKNIKNIKNNIGDDPYLSIFNTFIDDSTVNSSVINFLTKDVIKNIPSGEVKIKEYFPSERSYNILLHENMEDVLERFSRIYDISISDIKNKIKYEMLLSVNLDKMSDIEKEEYVNECIANDDSSCEIDLSLDEYKDFIKILQDKICILLYDKDGVEDFGEMVFIKESGEYVYLESLSELDDGTRHAINIRTFSDKDDFDYFDDNENIKHEIIKIKEDDFLNNENLYRLYSKIINEIKK